MSVSDRIASLTPEQKALFEKLRQQQQKKAAAPRIHRPPAIERAGDGIAAGGAGDWPLSYDQERLWFLYFMDPQSPAYNMITATWLRGALDRAAMRAALNGIVRRHGAWRTTFPAVDGKPVQRVAAELDLELPLIDLTALPAERREPEALRLVDLDAHLAFDLQRGPLLRSSLMKVGERDHICLINVHHIVNDWVSFQFFWRELAALYEARTAGRSASLPALPVQYSDFAVWQRHWMSGEVLEDYLDWWTGQLRGFPLFLELPQDRPRPADRSAMRGGRIPLRLGPRQTELLRELARREGATRFMTLLALTSALFHRLSGQDRLIVGTLNANRSRPEVESLIGFFLTQLPLGQDVSGDPTFRELLGRVRKVALGAYSHQELPFGKLVEALQPERDFSRLPLVQVLVQLLDAHSSGRTRLGDLAIEPLEVYDGLARYDLMLTLYEDPDVFLGPLEYNADIYDASTVHRMIDLLLGMLETAAASPETRVSELPAFPAAARQQVLLEWNDTGLEIEGPATVVELFQEQARRHPEAVAWSGDGWALTFAGLADRSNRLARHLRRRGLGPEDLVAIYLERTAEVPVALLGVLKAGAGYLPLDLAHPADRRAFMLEDAGSPLVLTQERLASGLPAGTRTVFLDTGWDEIARESGGEPPAVASPEHRAYVIYTSGSTGRPKGVEIPHRALRNFLHAMRRLYEAGPGSVMPALTTIAFDLSVPELYLPMTGGGTTPLLTRETAADGVQLARALEATGATVLQATPATYRQLLETGWPGKRDLLMLCGAEALGRDLADRLLPLGAGLWNFYGPTETTVWSTAWKVEREGPVSIGRPIANTRVYLLDRGFAPVPLGAAGELCIGGTGMARGYFRRPELTAERFIPDPLSGEPGARLYRTGDLARFIAGGAGGLLEYLGRLDHQVKLRGFRIELGEIEAGLRDHPAVSEAVVLLREDRAGDPRLTAYLGLVPGGEAPDPADLRRFLRESLPDYMVPGAFVSLPALPRNANGKVDRKALAQMRPEPGSGPAPGAERVAPRTPAEERLAAIWAQVLEVEEVGVFDDFFDRGGHSLLATQLVMRIRDACGVELPVRAVFQAPTVAAQAEILARAGEASSPRARPIRRVSRNGPPPLSFAQERLWFLDQLVPGSPAYNIASALRVSGGADPALLEGALAAVIERHEALRTTFGQRDGRPFQVIHPPAGWPVPVTDLSGEPDQEAVLRRLAAEESLLPFDLARGPLLRTRLLRLSEREHVLLLTVHHIAADLWATGVLVAEVGEAYRRLAAGDDTPLPELPVQYADFAVWQREWLTGEELDRQLAFWRQELAGAPPALDLPTDRPRPPAESFRGASVPFAAGREIAAALAGLGRERGATLFMTLTAALGALLGRYARQDDVVLGSPIANRQRPELEGLIGMFVNTLALRVRLDGEPTFEELLDRVRRTALDAYEHQDVPFEKLVEELRPQRDLSRHPLFQVLFALQNVRTATVELPGLTLAPIEIESATTKFDMTFTLFESGPEAGTGIGGRIEYAADLFEAATLDRLAAHFRTLLAGIAAAPSTPVWDLPLLSEGERDQLLALGETAGETPFAGSREATIPGLFAAQAARTPAAVALTGADGSLTYGELDGRANRLARYLRRRGVGPEVRVAVALPRGLDLVAALLAVLKAGGAYVPLDPGYPPERLSLVLEDSDASLLLTASGLVPDLGGDRRIHLDAEAARIAAESADEPEPWTVPGNLAYLIYTSGSTGRPKGVAIEHRSPGVLLQWAREVFSPEDLSGVLASTSVGFDLSIFELFVPLAWGGRAVLAANALDLVPSPPPHIAEAGISLINSVPSAIAEVLRSGALPASARAVNLAGEALPRPLVERLYAAGVERVYNLYGPSEDTTYSTCALVARGDARSPGIGRPIAGTRARVLDPHGQPVPEGVPGELFLGGEGLARGYFGRPDLTAERFVPDPFGGPGARLYRTGDLARWRGGELEFLGRVDHQVKIRGFRIELGEIEAALRRHPEVGEAAVVVREDPARGRQLVGYVTLRRQAAAAEAPRRLRAWLARSLPEPMVPAAVAVLEALPLNPNGKVDRRALARRSPEWTAAAEYVAPRTEMEERLVAVCAEVLGLEKMSVLDNFFDLGGHSLLATQMVARLRDRWGIEVPLQLLFDTRNLADLADRITERELAGADDALLAQLLREMEEEGE